MAGVAEAQEQHAFGQAQAWQICEYAAAGDVVSVLPKNGLWWMVTGLPLLYSCQTSGLLVRRTRWVQMVASMQLVAGELWGLQQACEGSFVDVVGCMYARPARVLGGWGGLADLQAAWSLACHG